VAQTIQKALDSDKEYSYCTQRRLSQLEFENKSLRELLSIASEASVGSSLLQNSTITSALLSLQDTTQSSPKSPSSPLSPPPSDDHDNHRRQVFNTLFGNSEPQFKNKSPTPFINDNDHMPVITTPAMSPSVSLSPHTPSNDNVSFTADIILPENNDLVRSEVIDEDEMTESLESGTATPIAGTAGIVSSNNKMLFRRTAEEYISNR